MKFLRSIYVWLVDLLSPKLRVKRDLGDKALKILQEMDSQYHQDFSEKPSLTH